MRMQFIPLVITAFVLMSACATSRPSISSISYVAPEVRANDAQTLASDAVNFLAAALPPAKTTLLLNPPATGQSATPDVLTSALTDRLRRRGYGIAVVVDERPTSQTTQATPLRYLASPLDNGIVLCLQFKGQEATKLYPRTTNGTLLANGPFLLRVSANEQ